MAVFSSFNSSATLLALVFVAVVSYTVLASRYRSKGNRLLPPGPSGYPIIGNLADLPPAGAKEWVHWAKHKELYGPISSLTVLGQTLVIISDHQIAIELMEKRSATTSSRPVLVFGGKMCGYDRSLAIMPYSWRHRAYRKSLHAIIGTTNALDEFRPFLELDARRFLVRLLDQSKDLRQHIRNQVGSTILKIGYGYTVEPHTRDPLVDLANETLDQFGKACVPGAWMVDVMPFLRHMPDWMPGTSFKRTAREWKSTLDALVDRPHAFVQGRLRDGTAQTSYLSKLLEDKTLATDDDEIARWSAGSLYGGGTDTTVSSIASFFLSMTQFPDVQRKAQAEIDSVIGTGRLPNSADRKNLPYVDAMVKEVLRWHPVVPMSIPHLTTKDDMYEQYFIPNGSILIPNIWAMLHDPAVYHEPNVFKPERFLGPSPEPDPHNYSFGFGRRICPGKVLADATLFLFIADTLASFDIKKVVEGGKEVDPVVDFTPGVISHPSPFECDIKARSKEHEKLIRSVEIEHPWPEHGDAMYLK